MSVVTVNQLEKFVTSELGGSARVSGLTKTSLGRSRENWAFDVTWSDHGRERFEPLILRVDPAGGLVETDRASEFAILRALEASSVPAPTARWLDADGRWFGRPSLVMRREPGGCDYFILNGERPLSERVGLARGLCDLLVTLHNTPWRETGLELALPAPGPCPSVTELDRWEQVLRADQVEAYPELELALAWLHDDPPLAHSVVVVHGDFKPGNVLIEGTQITALLDWELAHLGDPAEDLGWMTQPLRHREHLIPGVWEAEALLEYYAARTGWRVPTGSLRWWNLFATFRTAIMQVSGLRSFLNGRSDEPYRPTSRVLRSLLDAVDA